MFPSSQEVLESKVGAEGGGGESQQAEPGEYDQEDMIQRVLVT